MPPKVQYITDSEGNKTGVILSLDEFENLVEDTHLSRVYRETKDEERISWEQVKEELIAEGKLER